MVHRSLAILKYYRAAWESFRHEGHLTLYGFTAWCGIAVTIVLDGLPVIQGQSQNG